MTLRFLLLLTALGMLACTQAGAAAPTVSPGPITSAGNPNAPVPFQWSLHESHRPDGHRLRLQGGTLHAIPSQVRLIAPDGRTIADAPASPLTDRSAGLCGGQPAGTVGAELPLPPAALAAFRSKPPAGYRVEAQVGGVWRPVALRDSGCHSIE